jgi:ElaB/YqjD/DUF883 family membrane-anchored ribosome-binding protein
MKRVFDKPGTQREKNGRRREEDEAEIARRIEKGINEAKAAISEKLDDSKTVAERFLKQSRYAVEDGLSELTHAIKRHPVSFLGIAFAAGAAFGLLISYSSKRQEETSSE